MEAALPKVLKEDAEVLFAHFGQLVQRMERTNTDIEKLKAARVDLESKLDSSINNQISEINRDLVLVESVIKIAQAHASQVDLIQATSPAPFERNALIRMQALIDNHSFRDPMAAKLYHEATAQRMYLNIQVDQIKAATIEEERETLSDLARRIDEKLDESRELQERYLDILRSDKFADILTHSSLAIEASGVKQDEATVCLGLAELKLPMPVSPEESFLAFVKGMRGVSLDRDANPCVTLPVCVKCLSGGSLLIKNNSFTANSTYDGIERFALDAMSLNVDNLERVDFVDPINLNASHFPALSSLTSGKAPLVQPVPTSLDEAKRRLDTLDSIFSKLEKQMSFDSEENHLRYVILLDQFPQVYDSTELTVIRRLCLNAKRYGILIVLIGKPLAHGIFGGEEALLDIESHSLIIDERGNGFVVQMSGESQSLASFRFLPKKSSLPDALVDCIARKSGVVVADNSYCSYLRRAASNMRPTKGNREIRNLPLGLDASGNVVSLSLEDDCFATFVCGATRSGKSTLLHSLLTGVFLSKHPDDVEVWLVDFKMTEFSRYIEKTPPHVKYVILDESPELVYDLIDRLMDYLHWRQKQFKKYQWEKLEDAQRSGRYMPAVLVVIDEFSVMSKIIADSVLSGKDYREKMQLLLAKGAALGFRFIFASQGFTKGTRGLSEYSKDQIQQRIAMKTTYEEIKATLDLPDISSEDKMEMEELEKHYALLKRPYGFDGGSSRLQKAHVLYFSSREEQLNVLSKELEAYVPSGKYENDSQVSYLCRTPVILDGNERKDFSKVWQLIKSRQETWESFDETTTLMCIGEPRRMEPYCPIELVDSHDENVLVLAAVSDGESVQSIVACAVKSLQSQGMEVDLCMSKNNRMMRGVAAKLGCSKMACGLEKIGVLVHELRHALSEGTRGKKLIILFDVESIFEDAKSLSSQSISTPVTYLKRPEGFPDLSQQLLSKNFVVPSGPDAHDVIPAAIAAPPKYDVCEDITTLLSQGPRFGYHFLVVTDNAQALKAVKIDKDLFKHKVFFNSQRGSAQSLVSKADLNAISETDSACFRYTNGLEGVTFRPYEHRDFGILSSADGEIPEDDYYYAG